MNENQKLCEALIDTFNFYERIVYNVKNDISDEDILKSLFSAVFIRNCEYFECWLNDESQGEAHRDMRNLCSWLYKQWGGKTPPLQ
ncbi:MAG: DUF4760 domain-containing protein [Deferribacteraceae bacterium]|nr:DUF4760 domain-containing protein [Deferribacteraceae bacterium]